MTKRKDDEDGTRDAGSLPHHDALLKKLSERTRGSGVGVVLTPEEMQALRDLSSLVPAREASGSDTSPPRPRKTSELEISKEERGVLSDLALGQARESQRGQAEGPRRRTTEIEVSSTELELLRRLSYDREASGAAAVGVQEQLKAAPKAPKRPVTLELTASEARWLAREAGARKGALTERERRAVLALKDRIAPPRGGRDR